MQALLLPAATSALLPPSPVVGGLLQLTKLRRLQPLPFKQGNSLPSLSDLEPYQSSTFSPRFLSSAYHGIRVRESKSFFASSASPVAPANDESDKAKLAQVNFSDPSISFKLMG